MRFDIGDKSNLAVLQDMVAPKVEPLRKRIGIDDDQEWKNIKEDTKKIFDDCGGHIQCSIKSRGWKSIGDAVRKTASLKVILFSFKLIANFCTACRFVPD